MRYFVFLLMLSLPVVCRAERLYCDKNMKPCKARKAAYYRDVDTLAGGKLSVRTYRLKDTSLYSRGVYMSLFPDKADTLLLYDEAGKLKEQETYGANDLCNTSRYYPSGELKAVSTAFGAKGRRSYTSWYSNKQLRYKYQTVAVSGIQELDGEVLSYYPNGKLKRKERYVKGVMQGSGERYDTAGNPVAFYPFWESPCYDVPSYSPTCFKKFGEYVIGNIYSYVDKNTRGSVFKKQALVSFVIGPNGKVERARLLQSTGSHELDYAAVQVVIDAKGWTPGKIEGEPTSVSFVVPITINPSPHNHTTTNAFGAQDAYN